MLRSVFISLSKASWAQKSITRLPVAWRTASRFVAGESAVAAIQVIQEINAKGINATLDFLGENTNSAEEAAHSTHELLNLLDLIHSCGVRSNISIKLSQVGLTISDDLCRENLATLLERARQSGNFIRIDMEDSSLTSSTIQMLEWARESGYSNTGIVLQAYLHRTEKDLQDHASLGIPIRLCKGAYNEPSSVAFQKMREVNVNYDRLARLLMLASRGNHYPLLSQDGRIPPMVAIASHDPDRILHARRLSEDLHLPKEAVEYQFLYGIRRDLQADLARSGLPVRVYVPYGTHWYPYFMRRLAERPANVWFFISNFFKK